MMMMMMMMINYFFTIWTLGVSGIDPYFNDASKNMQFYMLINDHDDDIIIDLVGGLDFRNGMNICFT